MTTSQISLGKKILFSSTIVLLVILSAEFIFRAYYAVKNKDAVYFKYGISFIKRKMTDKNTDPDIVGEALLNSKADEAFQNRKNTYNLPPKISAPETIVQFGYPTYINKYGLRNPDFELKKKPGITRIMANGGSFVAGMGVDDDNVWMRLLDEEVAKLSTNYEFILGEAGGGGTMSSVLYSMITRTVKFNPDYVIIINAYNNHKLVQTEKKYSVSWKISSTLYNLSLLYAAIKEKIGKLLYASNDFHLYNFNVRTSKGEVDRVVESYLVRLSQVYTVSKENNFKLILGLQPENIPAKMKHLTDLFNDKQIDYIGEKLSKQGYLSYYEFEYYLQGRFNRAMKEFALDNNILLFDCVSIFPEDKSGYFIDQIHPNAKGTAVIAKALTLFLIKNGIAK